jgi:hypothetical protein
VFASSLRRETKASMLSSQTMPSIIPSINEIKRFVNQGMNLLPYQKKKKNTNE